jgi:hypothetical protein
MAPLRSKSNLVTKLRCCGGAQWRSRFVVFPAAFMKIQVLWGVTPCTLEDSGLVGCYAVYTWRFRSCGVLRHVHLKIQVLWGVTPCTLEDSGLVGCYAVYTWFRSCGVLRRVHLKIQVLWGVTPCSLEDSSLVGCYAVYTNKELQTFRRSVGPLQDKAFQKRTFFLMK